MVDSTREQSSTEGRTLSQARPPNTTLRGREAKFLSKLRYHKFRAVFYEQVYFRKPGVFYDDIPGQGRALSL
jgi:hypothetical protein